MNAIRYFKLSAYCGIAILMASLLMPVAFPNPQTVPWMPDGFVTPILAYEFLASQQEAFAFIGNDPDFAAQMRMGLYIDMLYLVIYGAFLAFAALACWQATGQRFYLAGAILAIGASGFDALENIQLLEIIAWAHDEGNGVSFPMLRAFVLAKFLSLALAGLILSRYLISLNRWGKTFTVAMIINLLCVVMAGFYRAYWAEFIMLVTAVGWFCLFMIGLRYPQGMQPLEK